MVKQTDLLTPWEWPVQTVVWSDGRFLDCRSGEDCAPPLNDTPTCVLFRLDAAGDLDAVLAHLSALKSQNAGHYLVLVHAGRGAADLVRAVRAGVRDAVDTGAAESEWGALAARAREHVRRACIRRDIANEHAATVDRLNLARRDLNAQLERTSGDLARANADLTRHMEQLSLLYSFGRDLSTAPNWDATLSRLLESLSTFVGARGAALVLRPAPGAPVAPRQTWRWEESAWDRVLIHLEERHAALSEPEAPGIFQIDREGRAAGGGDVTALALEHMGLGFGYLLLLGLRAEETPDETRAFLKTVQVILSEEVAAAQMLDRMRELSIFNTRILETVRSGIWVIDEQARTIYSNRIAREMLSGRRSRPRTGAPELEIGRGRSALDPHGAGFLREHGRDDDLPELFLDGLLTVDDVGALPFVALSSRERGFQGEGYVQRPDAAVPVLVTTSQMAGRGENERWLVVVLEDLQESKKLAAEKQRADGLQSLVEMSATLAHEIRNPLMGLSAQAELLGDKLEEDDPKRRHIDVITGEVETINETITRMLQYVRPCELRLEEADLAAVVDECVTAAGPRAAAGNVRFEVDCAPESRAWRCDRVLLRQVVMNLLFNAVDESPDGGVVDVVCGPRRAMEVEDPATGTRQRRPGLRLRVVDRGRGFGSTDPESLFRPFFTTKTSGTGLGLSISKKIVTAHGGNILAERIGEETVFSILLPADRDGAATQREEQA